MIENVIIAYIEPSAMSYVVQTVAGIALGLGTVASLIFAFLKKRSAAVLKSGNISKEEIEEDVIIKKDKSE